SKISHGAISAVDAHSYFESLCYSLLDPILIGVQDFLPHIQSHPAAIPGVGLIIRIFRITKKYHNRVSDKFINGPSILDRYLSHIIEVSIQEGRQNLRISPV